MADTFLNSQVATYGAPSRPRRQPTAANTQTTGGGTPWMPNGTPSPQPQQAAPAPQPSQTMAPAVQQGTPPNTGTVNAQGVYSPGQAPSQQYTPQAVQQFQAPAGMQQTDHQLQGLLQQLMGTQTFSPQNVAQMKGQGADQAALLGRQAQGQLKDNLAARGISSRLGMGQAQNRQIMSDTGQQILNNNRNIDLAAAQQQRQDLLSSLQAGGDFQNSVMGRALSGYNANLSGLGANRDEATTSIQSALQQYQAGLQGQQLASQSALGAQGNALQGQQLAQQGSQFDRNFGLDTQKFDYQKTVDDRQFGAQAAAQGAANSQWADQMAFQYQKAQQDEFNGLLQYLMSGGQ